MREKIVPMRGNTTALRAGTDLDDGWLRTRSFVLDALEDRWEYLTQLPPDTATPDEKPHAEFMLGGGIEMVTPSFFDASSFESWLTLVGHWYHISGNGGEEDDAHFERGRVKKAWSDWVSLRMDCRVLVHWWRSLKDVDQVRRKGTDCGGLSRRGNGPCLDERSVHGTGESR
ncbi:hypothetical protein EDD85DRAFT_783114 [Armillaria nabsnona]|nr:hypothetical protein EDD85DRAFT_783114 [Armillaria nabsnona]